MYLGGRSVGTLFGCVCVCLRYVFLKVIFCVLYLLLSVVCFSVVLWLFSVMILLCGSPVFLLRPIHLSLPLHNNEQRSMLPCFVLPAFPRTYDASKLIHLTLTETRAGGIMTRVQTVLRMSPRDVYPHHSAHGGVWSVVDGYVCCESVLCWSS